MNLIPFPNDLYPPRLTRSCLNSGWVQESFLRNSRREKWHRHKVAVDVHGSKDKKKLSLGVGRERI